MQTAAGKPYLAISVSTRWQVGSLESKDHSSVRPGLSAPWDGLHADANLCMAANSRVWSLYDGQAELVLQANTIVPSDGPQVS